MGLTIKEALKFGGLFGASVVAGKEGLDTPIESVSVLEVAEHNISRWVLKNQLYITSSYYKVVVFIDSLQGLYAILLEILWIVYHPLPLDGL